MKGEGEVLAPAIDRSRSQLLDYVELMKPELTGLSVLTALCGFYLGTVGPFNFPLFLLTAIGTLLVGGGAGALNQYMEREYDSKMRRTERRPLPSGRVKPPSALYFGVFISVVGIFLLTIGANVLTGMLAVITITTYLFLYTPLKRLTPLSSWVGGIPGALPPVMGWTAATNDITLPAVILFAILFFWQIPHFHSLAWLYRKDYARAGFKMLSVVDKDGSRMRKEILLASISLIAVSFGLSLAGSTGTFYLVGAAFIGLSFLICGLKFSGTCVPNSSESILTSNLHARRIFSASLLYLPILMTLVGIDKL